MEERNPDRDACAACLSAAGNAHAEHPLRRMVLGPLPAELVSSSTLLETARRKNIPIDVDEEGGVATLRSRSGEFSGPGRRTRAFFGLSPRPPSVQRSASLRRVLSTGSLSDAFTRRVPPDVPESLAGTQPSPGAPPSMTESPERDPSLLMPHEPSRQMRRDMTPHRGRVRSMSGSSVFSDGQTARYRTYLQRRQPQSPFRHGSDPLRTVSYFSSHSAPPPVASYRSPDYRWLDANTRQELEQEVSVIAGHHRMVGQSFEVGSIFWEALQADTARPETPFVRSPSQRARPRRAWSLARERGSPAKGGRTRAATFGSISKDRVRGDGFGPMHAGAWEGVSPREVPVPNELTTPGTTPLKVEKPDALTKVWPVQTPLVQHPDIKVQHRDPEAGLAMVSEEDAGISSRKTSQETPRDAHESPRTSMHSCTSIHSDPTHSVYNQAPESPAAPSAAGGGDVPALALPESDARADARALTLPDASGPADAPAVHERPPNKLGEPHAWHLQPRRPPADRPRPILVPSGTHYEGRSLHYQDPPTADTIESRDGWEATRKSLQESTPKVPAIPRRSRVMQMLEDELQTSMKQRGRGADLHAPRDQAALPASQEEHESLQATREVPPAPPAPAPAPRPPSSIVSRESESASLVSIPADADGTSAAPLLPSSASGRSSRSRHSSRSTRLPALSRLEPKQLLKKVRPRSGRKVSFAPTATVRSSPDVSTPSLLSVPEDEIASHLAARGESVPVGQGDKSPAPVDEVLSRETEPPLPNAPARRLLMRRAEERSAPLRTVLSPVLKRDRMLVKVQHTPDVGVSETYDTLEARKHDVRSFHWAEYMVVLRPGRLELWSEAVRQATYLDHPRPPAGRYRAAKAAARCAP